MKEEKIREAFENIFDEEEMHDTIKKKVIQKRKYMVKRSVSTLCICCAVLLVTNVTCYAYPDTYRKWFSNWLGRNTYVKRAGRRE